MVFDLRVQYCRQIIFDTNESFLWCKIKKRAKVSNEKYKYYCTLNLASMSSLSLPLITVFQYLVYLLSFEVDKNMETWSHFSVNNNTRKTIFNLESFDKFLGYSFKLLYQDINLKISIYFFIFLFCEYSKNII